MIEFGIFNNQGTDLPPVETEHDAMAPGGTLADVHASAQRIQGSQVRQAVLADQLGFHYWFQTEHHFQIEGVEISPNPLITEAAIAVLTKQIRLGQIANVLTTHHPVRLAEMAAQVDVLSGGRLEFGIARGYQPREVEVLGWPFGTVHDQERNRALYEEVVEVIVKCWTRDSISHRGQFYTLPPTYTKWNHPQTIAFYDRPGITPTLEEAMHLGPPDMYSSGLPVMATTTTLKHISVLPQPLQKPHPQIWEPLTSDRSIRWAAERGINGYFIAEPNAILRTRVDAYMEAAGQAGWTDYKNRGAFKRGWDSERKRGVVVGRVVHVVEDGIGDLEKIAAAAQVSWDYYGGFGFNFLLADEQGNIPPRASFQMLRDKGLYIVGTREQVVEQIMQIKDVGGFEDFFFTAWFEQPGLSEAEIAQQMRVFMQDIAPALRERCGGSPTNPPLGVDYTVPVAGVAVHA
ncbi:MAG TPA: LLM class flavin-dependent oxidoreductase [Solirubrobacteraceae bacterium]|jgi:alkanesulfonate monooxygenase SsuD/methylene tetrahydromethanopterin reductase-like flavin-dependent oxidoreductase (luciferase family)|nr:LLM class flavin-dependent oxidoreductase [Solirubrobacteraceae bacterium]